MHYVYKNINYIFLLNFESGFKIDFITFIVQYL